MNRFICIHGHFYQPPRENPWLEEVELQETAHPYHDWNERIMAECYATNKTSRILNAEKRIFDIVDNYSKISFNFGPTLLSWMERHAPDTYQGILKSDQESQKKFSGHGSAMAQAYNHMIMPLANLRDKRTQVIWAMRDFEYRFKRQPEGMWLPETAVDIPTLEVLAEFGIQFTVLAPHQAKQTRKTGEKKWTEVTAGSVDVQVPYVCHLPSGKKINIFFYDGPVSHDVAFGGLLSNGEHFAKRLEGAFIQDLLSSRLVHLATDGETYGHHQKFGDMALSYCLNYIEANHLAKLTIYGEYLQHFPPTHEVEINENTSWSCVHGVDRWQANCGCHLGTHPGWHQEWRGPLRKALDWLRDHLIPVYESQMSPFHPDPWGLRDKYIDVVLNRNREQVEGFFNQNFSRPLTQEEKIKILKLLELERHAMLMYTSCGWFFDEISGIESTQIIQYAARAIQLAKEVTGEDPESPFVKLLEKAPSNQAEYGHGGRLYQFFIKPTIIDIVRVGAHYAISSLFNDYPPDAQIYCYSATSELTDRQDAGKHKLVIGKVRIRSLMTWEEALIHYSALHLGDHNLNGGVRFQFPEEAFNKMHLEIKRTFLKGDIPEVIRLVSTHFGVNSYSLWHLFKQEQKEVFDEILETTLEDIETHFRQIYEKHYPLMLVRRDLNIPLPKALMLTLEFVNNRELLNVLEGPDVDLQRLIKVVEEVKRWSFEVDKATMSFVATAKLNDLMLKVSENPDNPKFLKTIESFINLLKELKLDLNLWKAQNIYFSTFQRCQSEIREKQGSPWVVHFQAIGDLLNIECE